MDEITQTAFRELWQLWQNNQGIGSDPEEWDSVIEQSAEIWKASAEAKDPQFITDFTVAVLESLDRIALANSGKNNVHP